MFGKTVLEPDRWFGVFPDLTFEKFDQPKKTRKFAFWVKQFDEGRRHTTSYGNTYTLYQYDFFSKHLQTFRYKTSGWEITYIADPPVKHAYSDRVQVIICDTLNIYKELFSKSFGIYGVIEILTRLNELTKYYTWHIYDTIKAYEAQQKELKSLKSELELLHAKITAFEKTPLFQKIHNQFTSATDDPLNTVDPSYQIISKYKLSANFIKYWLEM